MADDGEEFVVDKILDKRVRLGKALVLKRTLGSRGKTLTVQSWSRLLRINSNRRRSRRKGNGLDLTQKMSQQPKRLIQAKRSDLGVLTGDSRLKESSGQPTHLESWCSWSSGREAMRQTWCQQGRPMSSAPRWWSSFMRSDCPGTRPAKMRTSNDSTLKDIAMTGNLKGPEDEDFHFFPSCSSRSCHCSAVRSLWPVQCDAEHIFHLERSQPTIVLLACEE